MSGAKPKHVCFYSNKCRWSAAFLNELKQTPYLSEVQFICVDQGPDGKRPPLPKWVKQVPTLVIQGEDEPRINGDVMNWLAERKLLDNRRSGGEGGQDAMEVQPWTFGEMGGSFTKSYSLLKGDSEDAPMGNFEFLNGASAFSSKTASDMPEGGMGARGQQQKSRKEALFDQQMESYMKQRSMGMPQPAMRQ